MAGSWVGLAGVRGPGEKATPLREVHSAATTLIRGRNIVAKFAETLKALRNVIKTS